VNQSARYSSLGKLLNPKNDIAFKHLFGIDKNKELLIHFINDVIPGKNVKDISFLKPSLDPDVLWRKESIVDVLCEDHNGSKYIVEMQVQKQPGFHKRAQYYASKTYSSQLVVGNDYDVLNEVIFIAITDFVMFPKKESYFSNHVTLDKETFENDLIDFSFTFIELPKFNKRKEDLLTNIDKWAFFFKYTDKMSAEELKSVIGGYEVVRKALEQLTQFHFTEAELIAYEAEAKVLMHNGAGRLQIFRDGKAEGIVEGEAKAKAEVAKNLKSSGFSLDSISKATGLTEDEIKEL